MFDTLWAQIIDQLQPGIIIRNWTTNNGYLGDDFKIISNNSDSITIETPGAKNLIKVPKKDFALMNENWKKYLSGEISRSHLRDLTYYSKYTISIYKYLLDEHLRRANKGNKHEEKI